ncbi:MAG: T9SS type A sorting domain-containing protein [Bacteroidales bacterium]|nr:T9SS type A sorting domain-containing protein [Bacteroidales bacterium]
MLGQEMKKLKFYILILFIVNTISISGQNWEREYGLDNRREQIFSSCTSYDKGFIMGIRVNDSKIWIIKTDVNGEVLWSKFIISNENIYLESIDCSNRGEIILTGAYLELDEHGDPFILKLDSCGNKAWCKVAYMEDGNYGRRILYSHGGDIIWHTYGDEDNYNKNHLWKIDNEGYAIWKRNIASKYNYPLIHSPLFENMHETSDHGYVLSGSTYYPEDTNNPNGPYILRSFILKTDSQGIEEWLLPAGYEEDIIGVTDDVLELNSNYYAVGYRYDTSMEFTSPLFIKISEDGELLYHTVINQGDTLENYLRGISFINDSMLFIAGRTRRGEEDSLKMGLFKTDTLGNIITWMENNNGSPINQCLAKTQDKKFLVTGYSVHGNNYQGYAVKVNENIEFDSLYTYPFNYDTLCPDSIISDTIFCDCDILVRREEIEATEKGGKILVYPNPATSKLIIQCSIFDIQIRTVEIFDLFGRKIKQIKVPKGSIEIDMDVSGWQRGLYLVKVNSENGFTESAKVILE